MSVVKEEILYLMDLTVRKRSYGKVMFSQFSIRPWGGAEGGSASNMGHGQQAGGTHPTGMHSCF